MAKSIEDFIWERMVDAIQNGAQDNDLRDQYDQMMSDRNYNNRDVNQLHDHILKMVDMGWESCRSQREEDKLIEDCIAEGISQHIGVWVTSDKNLANAIESDRIYRDLEAGAREWDAIEDDYDRAMNGDRRGGRDNGRGYDDRRGGRGGRQASGFSSGRNTGIGYSQSRPMTSRGSDRDDRRRGRDSNSRMTGGFGGGNRRGDEREERQGRQNSRMEREQPNDQRNRSPLARSGGRREEERPVERVAQAPAEEVIVRNEGPDLNSERPYDDFWDNNENWQLAHKSRWEWTWTPQQQFCRTYDPEQEVRFLVKNAQGKVREEFLPMSDDLSFTAHEIKALTRPNAERRVRGEDGGDQEISLPGTDIDSVDLNALGAQVEVVRKTLITELDLTKVHRNDKPLIERTEADGLVAVTATRLKEDTAIAASQVMVSTIVPSTGKGHAELAQLSTLMGADGELATLQRRLLTLRGKVDESVLTYIDKHYTEEVNHSLKHSFGFEKLRIDSFIADFGDLLEVITKRRNQGFTAQYLQRTRAIVPTLLLVEEEGRGELLEATDLLPEREGDNEGYTQYRNSALVFIKPNASVSVDIDLEAFGLVTDTPRVAVATGAGADPELRDALVGLYAIARKASPAGRVRLVTADNTELELVAMAGARDVVGVRLA